MNRGSSNVVVDDTVSFRRETLPDEEEALALLSACSTRSAQKFVRCENPRSSGRASVAGSLQAQRSSVCPPQGTRSPLLERSDNCTPLLLPWLKADAARDGHIALWMAIAALNDLIDF